MSTRIENRRVPQSIHADELAELASARRNGAAVRIEHETATGSFNWWEISNARIVGEACDRWLAERRERTGDRLLDNKAYNLARHERDFRLAVQARVAATSAEKP